MLTLSPGTALTLCVIQESANQPPDGMAAVARVVLNRTRLKYSSDGTIIGTILRHEQFSWTENAMQDGVYRMVAKDGAQEMARVQALLAQAQLEKGTWDTCQNIAWAVQQGTYRGTLYDRITDETVLYYNPAVVHPAPDWAVPAKMDVVIKDHEFFHA